MWVCPSGQRTSLTTRYLCHVCCALVWLLILRSTHSSIAIAFAFCRIYFQFTENSPQPDHHIVTRQSCLTHLAGSNRIAAATFAITIAPSHANQALLPNTLEINRKSQLCVLHEIDCSRRGLDCDASQTLLPVASRIFTEGKHRSCLSDIKLVLIREHEHCSRKNTNARSHCLNTISC